MKPHIQLLGITILALSLSANAQTLPNLTSAANVSSWDPSNTPFNATLVAGATGAGQDFLNFNNSGIDLNISYVGTGTINAETTSITDRLAGDGNGITPGNTFTFEFSQPVVLSFSNAFGNGLTAGGNAEQTILTTNTGSWTFDTPWPTNGNGSVALNAGELTFNAGSGANPGDWAARNTAPATIFTWNHTTSGNANGAALERLGFEIIPEPSSALLLSLGALTLGLRRKRSA